VVDEVALVVPHEGATTHHIEGEGRELVHPPLRLLNEPRPVVHDVELRPRPANPVVHTYYDPPRRVCPEHEVQVHGRRR
jgi:hypothetical protein